MPAQCQPSIQEFIRTLGRLPRICLVKQSVYKDLYNAPAGTDARSLLLSSNMRSGPAGLLTAFPVDFRIVHVAADPECQVWQQKITDCRHGTLETFRSNATKRFKQIDGSLRAQNDLAVSVDDIDWLNYDMVISYDVAVPSRICQSFSHIYWAYCITEGCMSEFRDSLQRPIHGYRVSLNHHFRPDTLLDLPLHGVEPGPHALEFPYFIQYYGCFHDLLCQPLDGSARSGVILDPRTKGILSPAQMAALEQFGPVRVVGGFIWQMLSELMQSKYYVRLGNHPVLGNSSIEAIAAGNLFLGSMHGIKNPYLLDRKFTLPTSAFGHQQFSELLETLTRLEAEPQIFELAVQQQRARLDQLCFFRPVGTLMSDYRRFSE